jgi:hypothetical protein
LAVRPLQKAALIGLAVSAAVQLHGQGTVNFSNIGLNAYVIMGIPTTVGTNTYAAGAKAPAGTTFSVALYFAPYDAASPVPPNPSTFTQVGASVFLGAAGTYNAGTRTANITPPGYFGWFQVKAWDTACGSTYEEAAANHGEFISGISSVIQIRTGDPTAGGSPGLLTGIGPIYLADGVGTTNPGLCVPEPSTALLVLLGAILVFGLSRNKRPC